MPRNTFALVFSGPEVCCCSTAECEPKEFAWWWTDIRKRSGDEETHFALDSGATEVKDSVEALTAWIPFQDTSARNGLLRWCGGT